MNHPPADHIGRLDRHFRPESSLSGDRVDQNDRPEQPVDSGVRRSGWPAAILALAVALLLCAAWVFWEHRLVHLQPVSVARGETVTIEGYQYRLEALRVAPATVEPIRGLTQAPAGQVYVEAVLWTDAAEGAQCEATLVTRAQGHWRGELFFLSNCGEHPDGGLVTQQFLIPESSVDQVAGVGLEDPEANTWWILR